MIKAVIFDVDGVMVITEHVHYEAWKRFCKKRGIELEYGYYLEHLSGHRSEDILVKLLGDIKDFEKLINEKEDYFKLIAKIKPVKGLYTVLKNLKKKYKIGVATSIPKVNIDLYLENLKIKEFLDSLVIGNDVKKGKPDPELYLKTAEKLKVKPEECVVVEDAKSGLKAAKNAGMKCIIVLNEFNKDFDFSGADYVIGNIKDVQKTVERMGGLNG